MLPEHEFVSKGAFEYSLNLLTFLVQQSLCSDVRARRRGVASVLKLCQKLLQQNQVRFFIT